MGSVASASLGLRPTPLRRLSSTVGPPVLVLVVVAVAWETASRLGMMSAILYPPPSAVVAALSHLLTSSEFFGNYLLTIAEIAGGFVLGTIIGFALGCLFVLTPRLRTIFYPYFVAFQAMPKVVLAPLFIVWLGFGPTSKVAMAVTMSFFPIMINTMLGLSTVDEDRLRLMESLRATKWQLFSKLQLPGATPTIFAGLKTGLTLAVFGTIAAEFVGSVAGVGTMIKTANGLIRTDQVLALVFSLGVFGLLLYTGMEKLTGPITFWAHDKGSEL